MNFVVSYSLFWLLLIGVIAVPESLCADDEPADRATETQASESSEEPELDAVQTAKLRSYQSILKVELSFLNRALDLNEAQLDQAVAAGKAYIVAAAIKDPLNDLRARNAMAMQRQSNPRYKIESGIQSRLKSVLSKELTPKYQAALEERAHFEKQAVVEFLVASMDSRLNLSEEQRIAIAEKLMEVPDNNLPELDVVFNYGRYMPDINLREVINCLSDDQRKVFEGIQKVTFGGSNNLDENSQFIVDDVKLDR